MPPDPGVDLVRERGPWFTLAAAFAALAPSVPATFVLHPPLAPVETPALGRLALGTSAAAALAWGIWGVDRSLSVDPDARLPRSTRVGTGPVRRPIVWLTVITIVATALRLHGLDGELWVDEIITVISHLDRPVHEIVLWPESRNVHLLYVLLMKVTTAIRGVDEWALRLPAAAFGVATIPAVYALGRTFLRAREALLAAALLAVSYHHVFFSQNARGYSALLFFTALATTFLVRALRDDRTRDWLGYGGAVLLGAATMLHGGLVLAGHALALGCLALRLRSFEAPVLPLVGKATLAIGVAGLAALDLHGTALPRLVGRAETARSEAVSKGMETSASFWSDLWAGLAAGFGEVGIVALLVLGVPLLVGLVRVARRHPVVVSLLVAPLAVTAIAFLVTGFHVFPRYFLWTLPVFALLAVASVAALAPSIRWLPAVVIALLAAVQLGALPTLYRVPKQATRTSLAWVLERSEPNDVLVTTWLTGPGVRFYLPRLASPSARPVEDVGSRERMLQIERRHAGARLWVLTAAWPDPPPEERRLLAYLSRRYRRAKTFPATVDRMETVVWVGPEMAS